MKGEYWEDVFDQIINCNNSNWNMGGHSSGADVISSTDNIRYQNKSGDLFKNNTRIKWSGSRTTSHATLEEKLKFISETRYDKYVMLARNKSEWYKNNRIYYFLMCDSQLIDYNSLSWEKKNGGWKGTRSDNLYSVDIIAKASDQFWISADVAYLGQLHPITVNDDL